MEVIEEASYEDDLWGAFELDEAPKGAPSASADAFGGVATEPQFEAEEFFSFEDESETIDETGPAIDFSSAVEEVAPQQSAEELFSFADESPLVAASASQPEPFDFPVEEPFSFEPEAAAPEAPFVPEPAGIAEFPEFGEFPEFAAPAAPEAATFIPGTPDLPVAEDRQQLSPAQPAELPASFSFSEADLVAALSKVSREVIERIVWEVVPDLAEVLIKEELRKLRAGIKG